MVVVWVGPANKATYVTVSIFIHVVHQMVHTHKYFKNRVDSKILHVVQLVNVLKPNVL